MMKLRFTLLALLISAFAFCQNIEGRWINASFSGEENLAYLFNDDHTMKMYYAGEEIVTVEPIHYTLKKVGDLHHLEMKYTKKSNKFTADLLGLVKFTGKNQMKLEFFDKKNLPEEIEFSEEALIFVR